MEKRQLSAEEHGEKRFDLLEQKLDGLEKSLKNVAGHAAGGSEQPGGNKIGAAGHTVVCDLEEHGAVAEVGENIVSLDMFRNVIFIPYLAVKKRILRISSNDKHQNVA